MRPAWLVVAIAGVVACGGAPPLRATAPQPRALATPARDASAETPDAPFRAHRPPSGPIAPFVPPVIQSFALAGGLPVYLVESHDLPVVVVEWWRAAARAISRAPIISRGARSVR